jgi:formylglycine-generating enzyme required for sulfatase activity
MRPVGQKSSNAWGLYDMQGNFSEWVADPPRQYERGHEYDPRGRTTESSVAVKVLWLDARSSMAKEPTRGVRGGPAFDWMTGLKALSDPETETGNRFRFASARRFRAHKESITGMSFRLALVEE